MTNIDDVITIETDHATLKQVTAAAERVAPQLARSSMAERATWLDTVAAALDAAVDELVPVADEEASLGSGRLHGEVARTTGQLRLSGRVIRDGAYLEATVDLADGDATPPRPDLRRMPSRSARSRCSARATSRSPSAWPAARRAQASLARGRG